MTISTTVQNACLTMLAGMTAMEPELRELQGFVMVELDKGSERNLAPFLNTLVELCVRTKAISEAFQEAAMEGLTAEDTDKVYADVTIMMNAMYTPGDLTGIEGLDPVLVSAIQHNLEVKAELEGTMDAKFGSGALMTAVSEDGLLPEFLEKMNRAVYPDQEPDMESINEFAKITVDNALAGVREDLKT